MGTSYLGQMHGLIEDKIINNNESSKIRESFKDVYTKTLCFNDVAIQIKSKQPFTDSAFEDLKDVVTGMQIGQDSEQVDGTIEYGDAEEVDVHYEMRDNTLIIAGPARRFGSGKAIAFTAHYMAECLRVNKSGLMLVHSAAIKLPDTDESYVFLGEKGAGKTTISLRLCHQYGYRLIGNDQVYMGANNKDILVTESGNAWFNVRETAISADKYIAKLLGRPKNLDKPSWNNKITVLPETIGVSSYDEQLPVKDIFHVRIDHSQPELRAMAWNGLQRNLIIHERFGRHITGQATPFQDDYGNYLGSLPPVNLVHALKARDRLVRLTIKSGITEIFSPDSDSAVDYIHNRSSRK